MHMDLKHRHRQICVSLCMCVDLRGHVMAFRVGHQGKDHVDTT
jgi:hypothetical protein